MNTTEAAIQASVTVATIRTWCRRNVIAAVKHAGRWVIDAASLAHRIAIGQMRTRKEHHVTINITATYTYVPVGDTEPLTITPTIRTRERNGVQITSIRNIAPLLADRIDAITNDGNRLHTLTALEGAVISIRSEPEMRDERGDMGLIAYRDYGRLTTSYQGTNDMPIDAVLDLAEQIRATL